MKVLRVTQAIYPYVIGGSPIHCHELSTKLSQTDVTVTVLTVLRGKKIENLPVAYDLRQYNWLKMPWDFYEMENPISPGLWWRLLRSDYDVLHVHSHLFFTSVVAAIINKVKGKPSIVTIHGVRAVRTSSVNLLQELWLQVMSRYLFGIVDKIICLTQADADEIHRYGATDEKVVLVSNGIDTTLFSPQDVESGYVLWVGRFVEEKGLRYLIDAVEALAKTTTRLHIVLVGDGPQKDETRDLIRAKGLEGVFEFKESCSQQEIAKLMKGCSLFVLPSIQEGFPKSLLEAMACGKPVVTTEGLAEIVGKAGTTVPARSAEALSKALSVYLSDPAKQKEAGDYGRQYVEENWSWDIVTSKITSLYDQVLHRSG